MSTAAAALKFEPIVSSNLESAAYDAKAKKILVRFKNGTAYAYPRCDEKLWKDFQSQFDGKAGRSAGKFLHAQLRARPYEVLDNWK